MGTVNSGTNNGGNGTHMRVYIDRSTASANLALSRATYSGGIGAGIGGMGIRIHAQGFNLVAGGGGGAGASATNTTGNGSPGAGNGGSGGVQSGSQGTSSACGNCFRAGNMRANCLNCGGNWDVTGIMHHHPYLRVGDTIAWFHAHRGRYCTYQVTSINMTASCGQVGGCSRPVTTPETRRQGGGGGGGAGGGNGGNGNSHGANAGLGSSSGGLLPHKFLSLLAKRHHY